MNASPIPVTEKQAAAAVVDLCDRIRVASAPAMLDTSGGVTTDTGGPMCPDSSTLRTCSTCRRLLPHSAFHRDNSRHDGCTRVCKECMVEYKRAWRESRLEQSSVYNRKYYAEHIEQVRAKNRHWSECHPEKNREYGCKYRGAHPARTVESQRRWREANPDNARVRNAQYRSRVVNALGTHTAADVAAQRTRQKGHCFWCGVRVGRHYHVDHVTPLALGGSNGPENLVVTCAFCNASKKDKHPMDFSGRML